MATKKLRAVGPDEKPAPQRPKTIKDAIEASERDLLVALRCHLADELASKPPAHTLAGLMKHLREVDKEIRAIDAREAETSSEEPTRDHGAGDEAFDPASAI